jgi:hypothetical protein
MAQLWVFTCSLRMPVRFNEPPNQSDRPKQPRFFILRTFTARRGQTALLSDVGKGAEESISWRVSDLRQRPTRRRTGAQCERLIKPPATLQLRGGLFVHSHTRPFGVSI